MSPELVTFHGFTFAISAGPVGHVAQPCALTGPMGRKSLAELGIAIRQVDHALLVKDRADKPVCDQCDGDGEIIGMSSDGDHEKYMCAHCDGIGRV